MYICEDCVKAIGPRVSPVLMVVGMRNVQYKNVNPESYETVVTSGWEISKEVKLCRPCAKMEPPAPPPPSTIEVALAGAQSREDHARRCKKPLEDCKVCQSNMGWFHSLSPLILSRVLQDRGGNHTKARSH